MAVDYEKIHELKIWLKSRGSALVGSDEWPGGDVRYFVLGSPRKDINPEVLASDLADLGIDAVALPKNQFTPNVYTFFGTNLHQATVDVVERAWGQHPSHPVVFSAVSAEPIDASLEEIEDFIALGDWFAPSQEAVEIIDRDEPLYPDQWVFLQVDFFEIPPLGPAGVKDLLVEQGYRAVNPLEGFFGMFERLIDLEEYSTDRYTRVLLNSGSRTDLTARKLTEEVFSEYGTVGYGLYKMNATFLTTPELVANQEQVDDYAWWQSLGGGAEDLFGATGDSLKEVMSFLQAALSTIPVLLWAGAGLVAAWGGWELYKYIDKERGGR